MLYLIEHLSHYADCYLVEAKSEAEAEELIQSGTVQPFAGKNYPDENKMTFTKGDEQILQKLPLFSKKVSDEMNTATEAGSEISEENP